jgi:hypothetical protein
MATPATWPLVVLLKQDRVFTETVDVYRCDADKQKRTKSVAKPSTVSIACHTQTIIMQVHPEGCL